MLMKEHEEDKYMRLCMAMRILNERLEDFESSKESFAISTVDHKNKLLTTQNIRNQQNK